MTAHATKTEPHITAPLHTAEYWYRGKSDPDQTVRDYPQDVCYVTSLEDVWRVAQSIAAYGNHIQRTVVHTACSACEGVGDRYERIPPETTRPPWRLTGRRCDACAGNGWTGAGTVVYHETPGA